MNRDAALLEAAASQHLLLPESDALSIVGRHAWRRRVEAELWIEVVPRLYRHAATPLDTAMKVRAGGQWLGTRGALFGSTALWWLEVDVPAPDRAQFLVPRGNRWIPPWMDLHTTTRWSDDDVIRHRDVRTCSATRALIDFASQTRSARAVGNAIDAAVRARRTALPLLSERLAGLGGRGRHGCAMMRELLLDSGGESFLERRFLRLLREHGLPRPDCQRVFRADGASVARVDFHFPGTNVVVEVTGRLGHSSDAGRQRDARRRNHLQRLGQTVLEFTTSDVIDDPRYVLATLRRALCVMG